MDSPEMDQNDIKLRESLLAASQPQQQQTQQQPQQSSPRHSPSHASLSSRHIPPSSPSDSHPQPSHSSNNPQQLEFHPQHHAAQRSPHGHIDPAIAAQFGIHHAAPQSTQPGSADISMSGLGSATGIAPMPEGGLHTSPPRSSSGPHDSRKSRELSSSKRAAQNRAAQRAFRQRKESYIKKLEDDVRNAAGLPALQEEYHRVQAENYHLRDYIMALQSRLLEVHGDYPPAPTNIELRDPREFQQQHGDASGQAPMAAMSSAGAVEQLQAAAAQAAGFGGELGDKPGDAGRQD